MNIYLKCRWTRKSEAKPSMKYIITGCWETQMWCEALRCTCNFVNKYLYIFIGMYGRAWDEYNSKRIRRGLTMSGILNSWASAEVEGVLPARMLVFLHTHIHSYKWMRHCIRLLSQWWHCMWICAKDASKKDECMEAIKLRCLKVNLAIIYWILKRVPFFPSSGKSKVSSLQTLVFADRRG